MASLLAGIIEGVIIGTSVFVVCFGVIYLLFFRGQIASCGLDEGGKLPLADCEVLKSDYRMLSRRLVRAGNKYKVVLLAASSVKCLPITIPVNVSICLAEEGKRCLLVDMDLKRDAIAAAFQIEEDSDTMPESPVSYETSFENLRLWPAHNFRHISKIGIASVVGEAYGEFDFIIISDPYMDESAAQKQVAESAECGIVFAKDAAETGRLTQLLKTSQCSLIGNVQVTSAG